MASNELVSKTIAMLCEEPIMAGVLKEILSSVATNEIEVMPAGLVLNLELQCRCISFNIRITSPPGQFCYFWVTCWAMGKKFVVS